MRQGPLIGCQSFLKSPLFSQHIAEIIVRRHVVWRSQHGRLYQFDPEPALACHVCQDPQQVQCDRLIRVGGKDLSIKLLCLSEAPSSLVPHGRLEHLLMLQDLIIGWRRAPSRVGIVRWLLHGLE
jgi:hypothetical protein